MLRTNHLFAENLPTDRNVPISRQTCIKTIREMEANGELPQRNAVFALTGVSCR
jgi:hypothetical protein